MKNLIIGLGLWILSMPGLAQWELDSDASRIDFISVKNAAIAESHHFTGLVGYIGSSGHASVTISLDSVETLIPIRNERMREMLFKTDENANATIATQVDGAILSAVAEGGTVSTELPLTLTLNGVEKAVTAPVVVIGEGDRLQVVTARPIIIGADDYDLGPGVEALRQVAGLANISTAVPVTVNLTFRRAE